MSKPVLAIDYDDVIFPLNDEFFKFHNEKFGTNMRRENHISFNYEESFGLPTDLIMERLGLFYKEFGHTSSMPLLDLGQIERLRTLFRLHIVTARCDNHRILVQEYIEHHYEIANPFEELHFCNGFVVSGDTAGAKRKKSEVCVSIGAAYLVDDALHNAEEVAKSAGIPVFLLDNPWNQSESELSNVIHRVPHWEAVVSTLEQTC